MAPWTGPRRESWARNGNLLTVALLVASTVWLGFQVWAAIKHDPTVRPPAADTALMAVLGAWVTNRAVESRQATDRTERRVTDVEARAEQLEQVAETAHPDVTRDVMHSPPPPPAAPSDEGPR